MIWNFEKLTEPQLGCLGWLFRFYLFDTLAFLVHFGTNHGAFTSTIQWNKLNLELINQNVCVFAIHDFAIDIKNEIVTSEMAEKEKQQIVTTITAARVVVWWWWWWWDVKRFANAKPPIRRSGCGYNIHSFWCDFHLWMKSNWMAAVNLFVEQSEKKAKCVRFLCVLLMYFVRFCMD